MNRIDLRVPAGQAAPDQAALRGLLPRAALDVSAAVEQMRPVVESVRDHGASAVREASARFDGVTLSALRVPGEALKQAEQDLDPAVRAALGVAIERARLVHTGQRREDVRTQVVPGGTVTQRWRPVRRVGLYVPGGVAPLQSSVVMNVVPAQVAGVESIAVSSPPRRDTGLPHPNILAACALLGVDEVYAVGGAQAIAMFAYGTEESEPVDLVTGPGNIWVTAAKRLVRGTVGIDAEAGPTEIAILADGTADPVHVAADLISQAEHDTLAASVLVTPSEELLAAVERELDRQVPATRHAERIRAALTGTQSAAVLVDGVDAGLRVVDAYAAEHLEIQTRDARTVAERVRNAGAIFVGPWSPVSLGDYCAGSNHVLPTGGCARHSSGLSVQAFLRGVQLIEYDAAALRDVSPHVLALAEAEDLPAHGEAVSARFPA
ncbi:MAG TPA: histidinol dehydrogenase [Rugosimonospora sp.]|nr:histidinol dehydrogenase [Rugosimonospora sp.]